MTEPRRTPSSSSAPQAGKSQAARNAVRNSRSRKAEELEASERRKRRSIAQAERRTTPGRAPEGTGADTPASYLDIPEDYRAGFACFVGRPNAGKSTLTNALVGAKIAITSGRPQTTRHTVRGIVHRPDAQLVLVDTPGLHRPRTLLGERLNEQVRATWAEVDVIGFCIPADQEIGPGDRYIAQQLAQVRRTPKLAVVTKTDAV